MRVNYTTYDIRRAQDSVNYKSTHCDVMVLSRESDPTTQFWYARVIGVFHVIVLSPEAPNGQRVEVLWVRWFGRDPSYRAGWEARRLERIGFVPHASGADDDAFGFLDPNDVVRACHLIPCFAEGKTREYLGPSEVRDFCLSKPRNAKDRSPEEDYRYYFVNR